MVSLSGLLIIIYYLFLPFGNDLFESSILLPLCPPLPIGGAQMATPAVGVLDCTLLLGMLIFCLRRSFMAFSSAWAFFICSRSARSKSLRPLRYSFRYFVALLMWSGISSSVTGVMSYRSNLSHVTVNGLG